LSRKVKSRRVITFSLVLVSIILLSGLVACSSGGTGTEETVQDQVDSTGNTLSDIKTKLNKANIYGATVSPDNGFVAYIQGNSELWEGQLYLWQVGSSEPKLIPRVNDRICKLLWSPNSSYLFVDIGTSVQREGIIVSAREDKSIGDFGYTGGPCWSPDSKWVAVGMVNSSIQPVTPTELNGVQDLVLYNIQTKEKKVIVKATSEYDFVPREWLANGNLEYDKYYYRGQAMEKLIYSAKPDTASAPEVSNASASAPATRAYFGIWIIKKEIPTPNVTCLSQEQIDGYLGQEIAVNDKQVVTSKGTIKNPVYQENIWTNTDLYNNWRMQFSSLGVTDDTVTEIEIANYQNDTENGIGSGFILTNDKRLYTNIGGVLFELGK